MFSERAKTIALAIVKIFETSKPFGDYSAVAVLDDDAGISYGTSQFTHRSGSLFAVLNRFFTLGGDLPPVVRAALDDFSAGTGILKRSNQKPLRAALAELGKDPLMQRAQREIAFENYLKPALEACEGSDFNLPLSLAVIYDSMNHGSWAKIRDRVQLRMPASIKPEEFEKEWISAYVRERHKWLTEFPRLKKTAYRTQFFLDQIEKRNWRLELPLNVHGFKLTEAILFPLGMSHSSAAVPPKSGDLPEKVAGNKTPQNTQDIQDTTAAELENIVEQPSPVHVDNVEKLSMPQQEAPKPLPSGDIVTVKKERSSIWAKIGFGFAAITGLGINLGNLINNKLNEMTIGQLGYMIAGVAIIAAGLWLYDRSAQRAHEKTQSKMSFASQTDKNTVELN